MTIIEAIKSGKAFKRKGVLDNCCNGHWYWYNNESDRIMDDDRSGDAEISGKDILADDWIVREE